MASNSALGDPWYQKNLLSFDGGGVRGFSSLLILQALMKEIQHLEINSRPYVTSSAHPLQHRQFHPSQHRFVQETSTRPSLSNYMVSHYFDYITGTSAGGLIAIMLGRFAMTVDECIEKYEELIPLIFAKPRRLYFKTSLLPRHKHDAKALEIAIKGIVESRSGRSGTILKQPNENMCGVITLAWEEVSDHAAARVPILFRSYNHPKSRDINERNPGPPCTHPIWKVARATSAAPLYFELIQLEGISLIDGGFGANNPTLEAWQSIIQLHNRHLDAVKVIVSIGTGKGLEKRRTRMKMSFHQVMWSHYKTMKAMASDTEVVHGQMQSVMAEYGHYYRLNVEDGLGNNDVPLDACKGARGHKTLTLIRRKTEEHLNKEPAKGSIRRLAETLVAIRRARSNADRDRWERFCHGLKYTCPEQGCRDFAQEFEERQTLRNHLELKHPEKFDVDDLGGLEKWLDAGKSYSVEEAE